MTKVTIRCGGEQFSAVLEEERAPKTCAIFKKMLPIETQMIHVRWSGEGMWIPMGDTRWEGLDYENHTSYPSKGEMLIYPGGRFCRMMRVATEGRSAIWINMGKSLSIQDLVDHDTIKLYPLGDFIPPDAGYAFMELLERADATYIAGSDIVIAESAGQKKGGYGDVKFGTLKSSGRKIAAKFPFGCTFKPEDPDWVENFMRDVTIQSMVSVHPGVLPLLGVSMTKNLPLQDSICFVTPRMKRSANGEVSEEEWSLKDRYICCYGAARTLEYLQRAGIFHRDIKPENILLDDEMRPFISDFGLAKAGQDESCGMQSKAVGTPVFAAPEIFDGVEYSLEADQYSYALTVWCIFVKKSTPYENLWDKRRETKNVRPAMNEVDWKNKGLMKLVEDCWDGDPKQRPSFGQVVERLRSSECLDGYATLDDLDKYDRWLEDEYKKGCELRQSRPKSLFKEFALARTLLSSNKEEAYKLLTVIGNEYPKASMFLGELYESDGAFDKALECYRKAVARQYRPAFAKIGEFYRKGLGGLEVDTVIAALYEEKSVKGRKTASTARKV